MTVRESIRLAINSGLFTSSKETEITYFRKDKSLGTKLFDTGDTGELRKEWNAYCITDNSTADSVLAIRSK